LCPKDIIIAKYMEDSVVKSVDILLKDNLIRNLKKKLHQNQTKNKCSVPKSMFALTMVKWSLDGPLSELYLVIPCNLHAILSPSADIVFT
jgi:hypothetical protein